MEVNSDSICRVRRALPKELSHEEDENPEVAHQLNKLVERRSQTGISQSLAWDDLTGMSLSLDAGKVKEARQKEISYVRDKHVWGNITRKQARH